MATLDLVLLGLIGAGVVRGWSSGATRQLVSTLGWIVGFVVAAALMTPVGIALAAILGVSERTAPVVAFVALFGASIAGVALLGNAVRKTLEVVKLSVLDRLGGAGLGGFKAALGLSVALSVTALSPLPGGEPIAISSDAREGSLLHDPVRSIAPAAWALARQVIPGVQRALSDRLNAWDADGNTAG